MAISWVEIYYVTIIQYSDLLSFKKVLKHNVPL